MTEKNAQVALELCRTKALAYIGTVDEDGQPQVTPVWVDVREGKPAFNTAVGRAKERNLRERPQVSLTIADPDDPYRYVEVQGRAVLSEEGADQYIDDLAKKYLDVDAYPFRTEGEVRINVFVEPERYLSS
jgi:PPOX class probable F420-dependent enzyme